MIEALQIGGDSVTTAVVNLTPANVGLPTLASGQAPRWVLLVSDALCGFRPVQAADAPALGTLARLPEHECVIVNVGGYSQMRLDKPAAGTANVTITPLENQ